jgi:hypothetical protein
VEPEQIQKMIEAWRAIAELAKQTLRAMLPVWRQFHRDLYFAGANIPPPSRHPMTARKMRGAIRRLNQLKRGRAVQ